MQVPQSVYQIKVDISTSRRIPVPKRWRCKARAQSCPIACVVHIYTLSPAHSSSSTLFESARLCAPHYFSIFQRNCCLRTRNRMENVNSKSILDSVTKVKSVKTPTDLNKNKNMPESKSKIENRFRYSIPCRAYKAARVAGSKIEIVRRQNRLDLERMQEE